jgi:hypothetical protein
MNGRLSLACRARTHRECRISWCACDCHHTPDADRLVDLDDDRRDQ